MYDLIVLGGGPAGYLGAQRAGGAGLKTLLIEKRSLGGVCLTEGCIPSKTFLHSAKIYDYANHGLVYGVQTQGATIDQETVVKRKDRIVRNLVAGVKAQMRANKVEVVDGFGTILGRENGLVKVKVNDEVYEGKNLLIATGSESIMPGIPGATEGFERGFVLTNREILDLKVIPESLVVIGGGVIGLEMAGYFNSVGSKVTVIEMMGKIAGSTDGQISSLLQKNYEKKGIDFKLLSKVTAIGDSFVEYENEGETKKIEAAKVLMSIGRKPVTQGFGLENLNVYTERGHIVVDETGLTNIPGVYAAGDVNGSWMLAHAAYREAEVAVNNLLGKKDIMRYQGVASVIYTNPEVGSVGETKETCEAKGIECKEVTISMNYSGRYMAENHQGDGICKIIADPVNGRLLGCHIIGNYASEIILVAAMLIETEMTIPNIKEFVFPHPTVAEVIREAIFAL